MSGANEATILTASTIPKYVEDRWDQISNALEVDLEAPSAVEGMEVQPILGGNVNYAFRLSLANLDGDHVKKTLFLKQVRFTAVCAALGCCVMM
jgi:hypothetical protein